MLTELEKVLFEIAKQIIADVDDAVENGDLSLLYERMVANAEDLHHQIGLQNKRAQVMGGVLPNTLQ